MRRLAELAGLPARDPVLPNLLLTLVTDGGSDVLIKRFASTEGPF
ncbi:hypothetical protein ACWEOS_07420 [Micromonospora taraxaci]